MKLWIMAALIALMAVSAYPRTTKAEITGNELLNYCEDTSAMHKGFCMGFISGAKAGMSAILPYAEGAREFCDPGNLTVGQLVRVVKKYLSANPEKLHLGVTALVGTAIHEAWPCN